MLISAGFFFLISVRKYRPFEKTVKSFALLQNISSLVALPNTLKIQIMKFIHLFYLLCLCCLLGCQKSDLLVDTTSPPLLLTKNIIVQPLTIVQAQSTDDALEDGIYEAMIADQKVSIQIVEQQLYFLIPANIDLGKQVLEFSSKTKKYSLSLDIQAAAKNLNLKALLNELDFVQTMNLDAAQILQNTSEKEQTQLAQFLAANPNYWSQAYRVETQTKHESAKTSAATLAVGQSLNLNVFAKDYWTPSNLMVNTGEVYQFSSTGIWLDWFIFCNANGYSIFYMNLLNGLKRAPNGQWFELAGAVNQSNPFAIGKNNTITITNSGSLDLFANDANGFYWNNFGKVNVTITRVN